MPEVEVTRLSKEDTFSQRKEYIMSELRQHVDEIDRERKTP